MDICDSGHVEIVYQSGGLFGRCVCPLCAAIAQIEALEAELEEAQEPNDER